MRTYIIIGALFLLLSAGVVESRGKKNEATEVTTYQTWLYKVSYGPLRIATIKWATHMERISDDTLYVGMMEIRSNPKLFFLDVETYYTCYYTPDQGPLAFYSVDVVGNDTIYYNYDYHNPEHLLTVKLWNSAVPGVEVDSISLAGPAYDLMSLVYSNYHRKISPDRKTFQSYYGLTSGPVEIRYSDRFEKITPYDRDEKYLCRFVDGEIQFEGVAGLTGPFEFWLSDEETPMIVQVWIKVFLGSVKITLEGKEDFSFDWDPALLNASSR